MGDTTYLDRHTRAVESVGEQHTLAQHPVKTRGELDFGDGERMTEVEGAVCVGEGEVTEPLGELCLDVRFRQTLELLRRRGIDLKDALLRPSCLVLQLEFAELVTFASLSELDRVGGGCSHDGAGTRQTSGT